MAAGDSTHLQLVSLLYHAITVTGYSTATKPVQPGARRRPQPGHLCPPARAQRPGTGARAQTLPGHHRRGLLIDHFRRSALERAYLDELGQLPQAIQPSAKNRRWPWMRCARSTACSASCRATPARPFCRQPSGRHGPREIAERLGVSVSRVRQYLAQGLRQYIALYGAPQ